VTTSLLLTNGYIHSTSEPYANALHSENSVVAWLGSDETAERLVAATVSGPVNTIDLCGGLVTPAFIDGYSTSPITSVDARSMLSSTIPGDERIYYAPMDADPSKADGLFVASGQLDQLPETIASLKPPTQLLIQSENSEQLDQILDALSQQSNAALLRSRHRVLANHTMSAQQISELVTVHASITLVPAHVESTPKIFAPTAKIFGVDSTCAGTHRRSLHPLLLLSLRVSMSPWEQGSGPVPCGNL